MPSDWEDVLLAYLHDPPDKALAITGHVDRARRYAAEALGEATVERAALQTSADPLAAKAERVPAPHWETLKVDPVDGRLTIYHPLSGKPDQLTLGPVEEELVRSQVRELLNEVGDDRRRRFFALWRLLRERLADHRPEWARLPADTRLPDHTIWHHLDITAGLAAADQGAHGRAFLSFSLGPVQAFIAGARTVRDLWSGSMILSYLTFRALLPIVEEYGPTALVYPALRGVPLLDLWLRQKLLGDLVDEPPPVMRKAPCLPNRFLAVVPWGRDGETARALAEKCQQQAEQAWAEMADAVRAELDKKLRELDPAWAERWSSQIKSFFEVRSAVLPWWNIKEEGIAGLWGAKSFAEAYPEAAAVRRLAEAIPENQRPGYAQNHAGDWQARVELSARLMEASRAVRHLPRYQAEPPVPPKCSLLGTYEQMGPAGLRESADFWTAARRVLSVNGVRLRERERLCAVSLVKRFSGPCFLAGKLGFTDQQARQQLRFDDTATIAAAAWLHQAQQKGFDWLKPDRVRREFDSWSGQWLHWPKKDLDPDDRCPEEVWRQIHKARLDPDRGGCGWPPAYYAVLMLDGDDLGRWLGGEKSPTVGAVMHPDLRRYFEALPDTKAGLEARRPVGPALHAALSTALANFALYVVPEVVQRHQGTLIYSGGDDTLALLPLSTALACARELQQTYQREYLESDHPRRLLMGGKATLSAGLAVVHYKEDLRAALEAARSAEKVAKKAGKDALQLAVCRRSGEHTSALCPWEFVATVLKWVEAFRKAVSDRWAYHLAAEGETLGALEEEAIRREIQRQRDRAEKATREAFDGLLTDWDEYRRLTAGRGLDLARQLKSFVTLVQSASFLTRGRER